MTRDEILQLKGKLVIIPKPAPCHSFIGKIFRMDEDTIYVIDSCGNRTCARYQQIEGIREATGDEAKAEMLSDCNACLSDMNIESNL
jgi:hypothetical protein